MECIHNTLCNPNSLNCLLVDHTNQKHQQITECKQIYSWMLKKTDYKSTLYVKYGVRAALNGDEMFGLPSNQSEVEPEKILKLAEEGRVEIVKITPDCNTQADIGKTIEALRKSPGGIKGIQIDVKDVSESDVLEILKVTANHEYRALEI